MRDPRGTGVSVTRWSPKPQREVRLLGPPLWPDPGFPGFLALWSRLGGDVVAGGVPHGSAGIRSFRSLSIPRAIPRDVPRRSPAEVWAVRYADHPSPASKPFDRPGYPVRGLPGRFVACWLVDGAVLSGHPADRSSSARSPALEAANCGLDRLYAKPRRNRAGARSCSRGSCMGSRAGLRAERFDRASNPGGGHLRP
jgi:hypothetical protein